MMIGFAVLWVKHPPKKINWIYGYRTRWSSKSDETWQFAHQYFASWWLSVGIVLSIMTVLLYLVNSSEQALVVLMYVQILMLLFPIIPTERALRRYFDEEGNRK